MKKNYEKIHEEIEKIREQKKEELKIDLAFLSNKIGSGKYKDKTWIEAHNENPTYLQWPIDNSKNETSKQKFQQILSLLETSNIEIPQNMFDTF